MIPITPTWPALSRTHCAPHTQGHWTIPQPLTSLGLSLHDFFLVLPTKESIKEPEILNKDKDIKVVVVQ
jgi:hypothetical protein